MNKQKRPLPKVAYVAVLAMVAASFVMSTAAQSDGTWSNIFPPKGKFADVGAVLPAPELGGGPQPIDEGGPLIITEGP